MRGWNGEVRIGNFECSSFIIWRWEGFDKLAVALNTNLAHGEDTYDCFN